MTDRLVDFVNALDQDPVLQDKYSKDPKATAEAFGVSSDDVSILLGDDSEALKKRLDMVGLKAVVWIKHSK